VVTNIDPEHLDHWSGGLSQIVDGFTTFVNKIPFYGCAVLCLDHPTVREMLPRVEKRQITYGLTTAADYIAKDIVQGAGRTSFVAYRRGERLGKVTISLIGRHNVLNSLAALAVGEEVGVPFAVAAQALAEFEGIARRFELKGQANDVMVVDDYGHHPAEIRATLEAARQAYDRRLVVAFQPHRYTRTRDLWQDFLGAFDAADVLVMSDIYAAGETVIPGIATQNLAADIRRRGHQHVHFVGAVSEVASELRKLVKPGDLVLTLGAGSIWQSGEELLVYLREAPTKARKKKPTRRSRCRP
jgi:UDP-N-acetylmuramate--alanine ligase